jgi:hypothetical protein
MINAVIVLVLSAVMLIGGRLLMSRKASRSEGILSCAIGGGLVLIWYHANPSDFQDLSSYTYHAVHNRTFSDSPFVALAAILPAVIVFVALLLLSRTEHHERMSLKTIVGPLGRVRRPRILR